MKIKWYISTLILVLTLTGICINKISSPNQEILVQFNTIQVSKEQSQTAIASIKLQLLAFGIDQIQVREVENGKLKITYFSSVDVPSIKKILSKEEHLLVDYVPMEDGDGKFPSKKDSKNYNLDIYEIHKSPDGNNGASGKSLWIVKQDYDRFLNPNVSLPYKLDVVTEIEQLLKCVRKVNRTSTLAINNPSHTIPEVRAGPQAIGDL